MSTTQIGDKYFFTLDGELWFPKIHNFDMNGGGIWGDPKLDELTRLKNSGYDCISLPFVSSWANSSMMEEFFGYADQLGFHVIVNHNLLWEFNTWLQDNPDSIAHTYLGTVDETYQRANLFDPVFRQEMQNRIKTIVEYCETKSNVIAYQLLDSDFWSYKDDPAFLYRNDDMSLKVDVAVFAYNPGILEGYKQWLQNEKGFVPADLGFTDWSELFLPWNRLLAKNINHWLSWKDFRLHGLTLFVEKETLDFARTITSKPVGIGIDAGFCLDWQDQSCTPHFELDTTADFIGLFLGWNAPWLDSRRVKAAYQYARCPLIGFFDVTSGFYVNMPDQPIYPASQVITTMPWISGYKVSSGGKIGDGDRPITQENWDILTDTLNYAYATETWKYEPIKPKVGLMVSIPDGMKTGMPNSTTVDAHFISFAQRSAAAILARTGIPHTEIWHPENISQYDVVISEFTGAQLYFSDKYYSLTSSMIEDYVSDGGVFIKGPYPLREPNVSWIEVGDSGDTNSSNSAYIEGTGWSTAGTVDNIPMRNLVAASQGLIQLPLSETDKYHELSITYKDVRANAFYVEAKSAEDIWNRLEMIATGNYGYWRTAVLVVSPDDLYQDPATGKQILRIVNSAPSVDIPITTIEWASLADFIP